MVVVRSVVILGRREHESDEYAESPGDPEPGVLYADHLVRICDDSITFLHFSIPFFRSKQVSFSAIDHIIVRKPQLTTGKWRIAGSSNLSTWFALDWHRPSRDQIFLMTLKNSTQKIGFTVEDSATVIHILKKLGLLAVE
ncbi:MAG: hypothetical protein LUQ13_03335 [Methanomicrobiales archaeon]|nr:hypothetical protein [Methanomicrobiales archaeon]